MKTALLGLVFLVILINPKDFVTGFSTSYESLSWPRKCVLTVKTFISLNWRPGALSLSLGKAPTAKLVKSVSTQSNWSQNQMQASYDVAGDYDVTEKPFWGFSTTFDWPYPEFSVSIEKWWHRIFFHQKLRILHFWSHSLIFLVVSKMKKRGENGYPFKGKWWPV